MPYNYDPTAGGLIPEGTHILTIVSIEETTSSKGDPMWIVRLEDAQRRELTEWIVQTPRIIDWKFKPLWTAAGLVWPDGPTILDEQQLIDKQVLATITHERSDQFGTTARIQGYTHTTDSDLPGQETFNTGDQPVTAGARSYGQPDDDEDIPF